MMLLNSIQTKRGLKKYLIKNNKEKFKTKKKYKPEDICC